MLHKTILLILSLLIVTASSYEATLTKTLFYLDPDNTFTQPFFQTQNNVIAYNVEFENDPFSDNITQVPQFYAINLQNSSATPFFQDTMTACGHSNATYVRMFYHSDTLTLVYYCTSNNTLLILDQDNYTVTNTVQVNTTAVFNETKLYAEGGSVIILGMATPYLNDSVPTELIKIDLSAFQVVRQVTFNTNLEPGEVVTAYTSTNLLSFVLTTLVDKQKNTVTLTIYNVIFVSNIYKLTRLTAFAYSFHDRVNVQFYASELFNIGPYIVTNDDSKVLFFNIAGQLSHYIDNLGFLSQGYNDTAWLYVPTYAVGVHRKSSDLYAHYVNGSVARHTLDGNNLTETILCDSKLVSFVLGNPYANDLIFSTDAYEINEDITFSIIDTITSEVVYRTLNYLKRRGTINAITNSSYVASAGGPDLAGIVTYDLNTNLMLGYFKENYQSYYYEEVWQVYFYIEKPKKDDTNCRIGYYDPQSFAARTFMSYDHGIPCRFAWIHVLEATEYKFSPNFIIWMNQLGLSGNDKNSFLIHTQKYDEVIVTWPKGQPAYVIPNFDTMQMYYIRTGETIPYNFHIDTYVFNVLEDYYTLNAYYNLTHEIDYYDIGALEMIDPDTVVFAPGNCMIIDLASGTDQDYSIASPYVFGSVSSFNDAQNNKRLILSTTTEDLTTNGPVYMMDLNGTIALMPESNQYTQRADSGSGTKFWLLDVYPYSIQVLRFYDSLTENQTAIPDIPSQQQNIPDIPDIFDILQ